MNDEMREPVTSPYHHTGRSEMARLVPDRVSRLLDVGCNTGAFGEGLKRSRSIEVWGIEPNAVAAARAQQLLDKVLIGPFNEQCAVPDSYFDAVAFNDVLEHMEDPAGAVRLATRKLREGGKIFVSLPNFRHIDNLLHIVVDADFEYLESGIRDRTHLRFFTRKSALRFFESCGVYVEHVQGINEQWYSTKLWRKLMYRFLRPHVDDTRFIQFAFVLGLSRSQ